MNDHVGKPIDPGSFFATLARWTRVQQLGGVRWGGPATHDHEITLPAIEGVDVTAGLGRLGGNKYLYRDLLVQFAEKQRTAGAQITRALDTADRQEAERLAHS